ncbi:hypothetical protein HPB48_000532 [Haemaphysalis longicornis]|uniref:Uncharacterized protein n=1 Tax=Haemaphysalis longicornis TaxID=44386 RepID=A0A9J6G5U5_HAELO|nr:hypothetical protein HPB48_000532 [Haemaphysalis longicornis]
MSVWCQPNWEADDLSSLLDSHETARTLPELHLTNCIFADTARLYECTSRCVALRSLHCIGCPFTASQLLTLLLESLPQLSRLEFSLWAEGSGIQEDVDRLAEIRSRTHRATARNLSSLYVEVYGKENCELLDAFLQFCPNLVRLHVHHTMGGNFRRFVLRIDDLLNQQNSLEQFVFTSESLPPQHLQPEPYQPQLSFAKCASMAGNVFHCRSSLAWNCVQQQDLAEWTLVPDTPRQLVVFAALNNVAAAEQLRAFSNFHQRLPVQALCLVQPPLEPYMNYPPVGVEFYGPLSDLFSAFRRLTELNVNSFHFSVGFDMTQLLSAATFTQLRGLSASPCGLRHARALRRLAISCPFLDDLDIRVNESYIPFMCYVCERSLHFSVDDIAELHNKTNPLGRLTIVNVPNLTSLDFLGNCHVAELRFSTSPWLARSRYEGLGALLAGNRELRCLTLENKTLELSMDTFREELERVQTLRYLCLLSEWPMYEDIAQDLFESLILRLPHLEVLHVHYLDHHYVKKRVTWVLGAEQRSELQGGAVRPLETRGRFLRQQPCVICSMATFIGLTRPHNRGWRTSL